MTIYPFAIPIALHNRLPPPARDGNCYIDVCIAGKWDGVLVVDGTGMCIGIYSRRRIQEYPLPFAAADIEDIRKAAIRKLIVASLPFDLYEAALLTIIIASPIGLAVSWLIWPLFAIVPIAACMASIYTMYLGSGFPLMRLPIASLGICQICLGFGLLLPSCLP